MLQIRQLRKEYRTGNLVQKALDVGEDDAFEYYRRIGPL